MCTLTQPCGGDLVEDLGFRHDMECHGIGTRRFACRTGAHSYYLFLCPYPHEEDRSCAACAGLGWVERPVIQRYLHEEEARVRARATKNPTGDRRCRPHGVVGCQRCPAEGLGHRRRAAAEVA